MDEFVHSLEQQFPVLDVFRGEEAPATRRGGSGGGGRGGGGVGRGQSRKKWAGGMNGASGIPRVLMYAQT